MVIRRPVEEQSAAADVFRPMQYLGSKVRSLRPIADVINDLAPGGTVADPFAGTSVVGQALAADGHRVLASDVMQFAATFARALLGVEREQVDLDEILASLGDPGDQPWFSAWAPWADRESKAIEAGDGLELIDISLALPQVWRQPSGDSLLARQLRATSQLEGKAAFGMAPLAASFYAGTYFGLTQSLDIDNIRQSIAELARVRMIGVWAEAAMLTALLSATSETAFSAGKHYAQPHAIHREKNLDFAAGRILQDRRKSVPQLFGAHLRRLVELARPNGEGHEVAWAPVEALSGSQWFSRADVIYADPPYTAQQYSRFYHVPEVLVPYRIPALQSVSGKVTQGLYPEGRYKSSFSSKRAAPGAFAQLAEAAVRARASLVLSYSGTSSGKTGNDRMIGLEQLAAICRQRFSGRVEIVELEHSYRQFNGARLAVDDRSDREYLIACRADPR